MNDLTTHEPLTPELEAAAVRIRDRINRTVYDIGVELQTAKADCAHGQWLPFLKAACMGKRTAQTMMQYARLITDDWDIDTEKPLPSLREVLGANAQRAALLTDDAVDEKLEDEAEQRKTGWDKQADHPSEPEPRKATEPEPVPLEGEVIRPSTPKQRIASMQERIDTLEAENEALNERIAIYESGADELAVIDKLRQQISVERSQKQNRIEDVRRLEMQVKMLKREVKK